MFGKLSTVFLFSQRSILPFFCFGNYITLGKYSVALKLLKDRFITLLKYQDSQKCLRIEKKI